MDAFKAALAILAFAVAAMVAYFLIPQLTARAPSRAFEIPSGSAVCSNGKITAYVYNNGRIAMNATDVGIAIVNSSLGRAYYPPFEATTIAPGHSGVVIAAYGCGEPPAKCPPGMYTIILGSGNNTVSDRVRCG